MLEYEAGAGVNYCIYDGITFNFDADGVIYTIDLDPSKRERTVKLPPF